MPRKAERTILKVKVNSIKEEDITDTVDVLKIMSIIPMIVAVIF